METLHQHSLSFYTAVDVTMKLRVQLMAGLNFMDMIDGKGTINLIQTRAREILIDVRNQGLPTNIYLEFSPIIQMNETLVASKSSLARYSTL